MREIKYGALALAMMGMLAACGDDPAEPTATADDDQQSSSAASSPTSAAPAPECPAVAFGRDELDPGCWAIQARDVTGGPRAELELPAGFSGNDAWVWVNQEDAWGAITLLPAGDVYPNPCTRAGKPPKVGPTLVDFATALIEQDVTTTSVPVEVSVDGHDGLYLELTVPPGFDTGKCRGQTLNTWDTGTSEQPGADPNQLNRYWIVGVDGQRVVLALHTEPDLARNIVDKYTRIIEAATFAEG